VHEPKPVASTEGLATNISATVKLTGVCVSVDTATVPRSYEDIEQQCSTRHTEHQLGNSYLLLFIANCREYSGC
jgi:hypothetical protein